MSNSLQKANFFKRISAWLFDMVMCVVLATGCMALIAEIIHYDFQHNKLTELETVYSELQQPYYEQYKAEHPEVNFDITQEEYDQLSEADKAALDAHVRAISERISADEKIQQQYELVQAQYSVIVTYTFTMISVSLLIVFVAWHFIVPLILHDGRTLGKKIFGLAVMRTNGVRISNPILFVRSILGLYTMETMAPILFLLMTYFGMGSVGVIAAILVAVLDIGVMIYTRNNTRSSIHDLLSDTVVVDFASQRIFETQEALDAYLSEQAQISDATQTSPKTVD